jgi:hypothetical protein
METSVIVCFIRVQFPEAPDKALRQGLRTAFAQGAVQLPGHAAVHVVLLGPVGLFGVHNLGDPLQFILILEEDTSKVSSSRKSNTWSRWEVLEVSPQHGHPTLGPLGSGHPQNSLPTCQWLPQQSVSHSLLLPLHHPGWWYCCLTLDHTGSSTPPPQGRHRRERTDGSFCHGRPDQQGTHLEHDFCSQRSRLFCDKQRCSDEMTSGSASTLPLIVLSEHCSSVHSTTAFENLVTGTRFSKVSKWRLKFVLKVSKWYLHIWWLTRIGPHPSITPALASYKLHLNNRLSSKSKLLCDNMQKLIPSMYS